MLDMLLSRLKEPSSYVAIAALLGTVGWQFAPEHLELMTQVGATVAALIGFFMAEKKA
jgi:hypothetical protein